MSFHAAPFATHGGFWSKFEETAKKMQLEKMKEDTEKSRLSSNIFCKKLSI
jgi:hypothetical protein